MKYSFKYYLHDDDEYSLEDWLTSERGGEFPQEIANEIAESRPFYEVTVDCEYDDETGLTTILKAY